MAALVVALGGCARSDPSTGISDSTYVATMTELRKIQEDPTLDSAAQAAARRQVLQTRGLTPDALEGASRALASDPAHAAALVQEIDRRTRGDTTVPQRRAQPR